MNLDINLRSRVSKRQIEIIRINRQSMTHPIDALESIREGNSKKMNASLFLFFAQFTLLSNLFLVVSTRIPNCSAMFFPFVLVHLFPSPLENRNQVVTPVGIY